MIKNIYRLILIRGDFYYCFDTNFMKLNRDLFKRYYKTASKYIDFGKDANDGIDLDEIAKEFIKNCDNFIKYTNKL